MFTFMKIIVVVLTMALALGSCVEPGSDMYCQDMVTTGRCIDGSWPQACVSYDMERCGYKVRGRMFYCYSCVPVECSQAARDGVNYCYRDYLSGEGSDISDLDDLESIEEMVELFLNELEDMR